MKLFSFFSKNKKAIAFLPFISSLLVLLPTTSFAARKRTNKLAVKKSKPTTHQTQSLQTTNSNSIMPLDREAVIPEHNLDGPLVTTRSGVVIDLQHTRSLISSSIKSLENSEKMPQEILDSLNMYNDDFIEQCINNGKLEAAKKIADTLTNILGGFLEDIKEGTPQSFIVPFGEGEENPRL